MPALATQGTPVSRPSKPGPAVSRGLLWDTGVVSGLTLLAKFAGIAKSAVIARVFGSGHDLDSYLLAFLVPSFIADVFCGAIVPAAVPQFVELAHRGYITHTHSFYRDALRDSLKVALLMSALCAIGALIAWLIQPAAHNVHLIAPLLLTMVPIIPCAAVTNVWRAVLNSRNNFAMPAFTAVLTPAFIIVVVLLAAGHGGVVLMTAGQGGVRVLALATTLASVVEAAIMARSVSLAGFSIWPTGVRSHPVSRTVRREYLYLAATAAVGGGTLFIGQFMASTLSSGSVSVLNYGTRLASALLALGPAALSVAILPRFSLLAAAGDWPALRRSLIGVLSLSLGIGALVSITLFYSSSLIVRLTLQRGAFTAADTAAVAAVQAISILQLPFTAGIAILLRTLSAMKANGIVLPVFGAALVLNIALGYLLMLHYQVAGIASAAVIGQIALLLALLALVFREGRRRFLTVRCP